MRKQQVWRVVCGLGLLSLGLSSGCRSPWVQATVANHQNHAVSLVEVSYPGGSFGVQSIAADSSYPYRFRILSTGALTIDFNDAAGHPHRATGPELRPGQQGTLQIELDPGNQVSWHPALTAAH